VADPDEPGVTALSELFIKPDGSPRSREEAVQIFGNRSVWIAELNQALEAQLAGPPPLSVPPRIFLSYRWARDSENEWVARLAGALRQRGYVVILDQTDKPEDLSVPEFVARIAECNWFLAVLDRGYGERIGSADGVSSRIQDGWVFDEINTARFLSQEGRIRVFGFLREGDEPPSGFRLPSPGRAGNAVAVRDADTLARTLDQLFPPVTGVPPTPQLASAWKFICASHQAAAEGRMAAAFTLARRAVAACPDIADGYAQLARAAVLSRTRAPDGLAAAQRALAIQPGSSEMMLYAAGCAYDDQRPAMAAQYCVAILEEDHSNHTRRFQSGTHYIMGNVLDDAGQCYAGISHLEIARRLTPGLAPYHNDTGLAYRHVGDMRAALACFTEGLKIAPEDIGLLENQAAAFIEAGKAAQSREVLSKLATLEPGHPAIGVLSRVLDAWQAGGGSPPRLVPRITPRQPVSIVSCSACPANIPLAHQGVMLCAGCGAEREQLTTRCEVCNHDGLAPLELASLGMAVVCPYCREGTLQLAHPVSSHIQPPGRDG